jgi:xylulose-5-phosphate/fructose-6-phosphate phosphoketolase
MVVSGSVNSPCDVPTLETLAAVSILRKHLPALRIRVVNVVDLMKLQPHGIHPHGLPDEDFDMLFTKDKPVIFAYHGYPWLIHRLTYSRTNYRNIHVHGYQEEGMRQAMQDKLIEHRQYICAHGMDMPEVREWKWA